MKIRKPYFAVTVLFILCLLSCGSRTAEDKMSNIEAELSALTRQKDVFEKKLENVDDESLRNKLRETAGFLFLMNFFGTETGTRPASPSYRNDPFSALDHYSSKKEIIENYTRGLIAQKFGPTRISGKVERRERRSCRHDRL